MTSLWQRPAERIRAHYATLAVRERVLVTMTLLAATVVLWLMLVSDPLSVRRQSIVTAVDATAQRAQAAAAEQQRLLAETRQDPDAPLLRERDSLRRELDALAGSLGVMVDRFVTPERMPLLLEDLMRRHAGLELLHMERLPTEPLAGSDDAATRLFRHPLRATFRGSYFDVVSYLAALERSPWALGWRKLDYRVQHHPLAEVTVELETLSREARWIGL